MKVAVNGGAFEVVPAAAYIFNAPGPDRDCRRRATPTRWPASPASPARTVARSTVRWGQSQVDLSVLGVSLATPSSSASTSAGTAAAASTAGTSTTSRSRSVSRRRAVGGRHRCGSEELTRAPDRGLVEIRTSPGSRRVYRGERGRGRWSTALATCDSTSSEGSAGEDPQPGKLSRTPRRRPRGRALTQAVAARAAAVPGESLVQKMKTQAQGPVAITPEAATGKVGFVRVARTGDLSPSDTATTARAPPTRPATTSPSTPPRSARRRTSCTRRRAIHQRRHHRHLRAGPPGVPVFGSMLRAHLDTQGDLTSVNGYAAPDVDISVIPRLSAGQAAARAVRAVRADPPSHEGGKTDTTGLRAASTDLVIYRTGATRGVAGSNVLTYVVEVTNRQQHPRHGVRRRERRQARQPLLNDAPRPRPARLRAAVHPGCGGLDRGRPLPRRTSTRTSRTSSSAPARRTGSSERLRPRLLRRRRRHR